MSDCPVANLIREVYPGCFSWSVYSPHHRVQLNSHAIVHARTVFVFDPIMISESTTFPQTFSIYEMEVVLTNSNHQRDCLWWNQRFGARIFGPDSCQGELPLDDCFSRRALEGRGIWVIELTGGAKGETGFYFRESRTLVLGDAVVNLPNRGLEVLPEKYCTDPPLLRRNLLELRQLPIDRMFCAHGEPVMEGFNRRLADLIR